MATTSPRPKRRDFARFVQRVEAPVRTALVAAYGPVDGREAAVDALSWAWENWARIEAVDHQVAYLFRVGQSARRRFGSRPLPVELCERLDERFPAFEPALVPALASLPTQQRVVVVLVHGYGWSQAEVAELLGISPSTAHAHLARATRRLRSILEVDHVG